MLVKKKMNHLSLFPPLLPHIPPSHRHFSLITNSGPLSALPLHSSLTFRGLQLPFHVSAPSNLFYCSSPDYVENIFSSFRSFSFSTFLWFLCTGSWGPCFMSLMLSEEGCSLLSAALVLLALKCSLAAKKPPRL